MKRIISGIASVICSAALATGAAAQGIDVETVFRERAWQVEVNHDPADGTLWCDGYTMNDEGQTFALAAFDSGALALFVLDPSWSIAPRAVTFLVDVDYSRWTMSGSGDGSGVAIDLGEADTAIALLSELREANAVAVMNGDGRRLATFSLAGSASGIEALMGCWDSILAPGGNPSDPFLTVSDPF